MHEYSIVQALLERVHAEVRAHGALSVARVSIRLGELSGVEPELLNRAYETFREEGPCAGAPLDIAHVPARWECPACRVRIPRGAVLACPRCGRGARLAEGDEIVLDRVELEVA
jgi:hydrogenase nickel incorporation protein HypA/HybF